MSLRTETGYKAKRWVCLNFKRKQVTCSSLSDDFCIIALVEGDVGGFSDETDYYEEEVEFDDEIIFDDQTMLAFNRPIFSNCLPETDNSAIIDPYISSASVSKLRKCENNTTDVLVRICEGLDCKLEDIMELEKDTVQQ